WPRLLPQPGPRRQALMAALQPRQRWPERPAVPAGRRLPPGPPRRVPAPPRPRPTIPAPPASATSTPCPSATAAAPAPTSAAPAPAANADCEIIVPARPLSARGLATPYQLTGPDGQTPGASGCTEANSENLGAFVQATILN